MELTYKLAGDLAILIEFEEKIDEEISSQVHNFAQAIEHKKIPGFGEVIITYRALLVNFDPLKISYQEVIHHLKLIEDEVSDLHPVAEVRLLEIPMIYGGEYGPDLEHAAKHHNLTPEEVISIHSNTDYLVYFLGFSPGYPYMGKVSDKIATPRLPSPRLVVPEGSVGMANNQLGIYSVESPGGFNILGRTPLRIFNLADKQYPILFRAGDRVRFKSITQEEYDHISLLVREGRYAPAISSYEEKLVVR